MNRIIIIGNGFDRAHNLKTGYREFIDNYWSNFTNQIIDQIGLTYGIDTVIRPYSDGYVRIEVESRNETSISDKKNVFLCENENPYNDLLKLIEEYHEMFKTKRIVVHFDNKFFEHIATQCYLTSWLDIENEYYDALKKLLSEEDQIKRNEKVIKLNEEFSAITKLLEEYLTSIVENEKTQKHESIQKAFSSLIEIEDVATSKRKEFINSIFSDIYRFDNPMEFEEDKKNDPQYNLCNTEDESQIYFIEKNIKRNSFKERYCLPNTLLLNFNYTKTAEKLYTNDDADYEFINIHGELNCNKNPIIFGYGDELDDSYSEIEKLQDNHFLENIKSIKYHQTRNYRTLLKFIESGIYQVFVMGHSCGNSDRTLLNTLFEHDNCVSLKVYYRQFKNGSDDYSNLIRNISRNFNDKHKMRDIVVNWEDSLPLVPSKEVI